MDGRITASEDGAGPPGQPSPLLKPGARLALRWVGIFFPDCVRIPNLVVVLAVVSNLTAPTSFRKTPRGVVRLSLGAIASRGSFRPCTFGAPVT